MLELVHGYIQAPQHMKGYSLNSLNYASYSTLFSIQLHIAFSLSTTMYIYALFVKVLQK